jgi:chromosome partitioning protein
MQKGGVGKTTTTLNLGVALANQGARVLLVDIDPQANLTMGLGVDPCRLEEEQKPSVYEVLLNPEVAPDYAILSVAGISLIPATLALAGAELELAGAVARETLLRKALSPIRARYDYILIDAPPSLGIFTLNALTAADGVLVPLQVHVYAYKAMPQLEATIRLVKDLNPGLAIAGIVCTQSNRSTNLSQAIEDKIRAKYGPLVFDTVIPLNTRLAEAPSEGQPIYGYSPESAGAKAYTALSRELAGRYELTEAAANV